MERKVLELLSHPPGSGGILRRAKGRVLEGLCAVVRGLSWGRQHDIQAGSRGSWHQRGVLASVTKTGQEMEGGIRWVARAT